MTLLELLNQFPDETSCKRHLRTQREKAGIRCKRCNLFDHYWLKDKMQWQCKNCRFRTTLKSGTMFQNTKMPLRAWFMVMGYMTMTKKGFSSKEIQRQIGHKRYEPIWFMMHKIRVYMGKSNCRLDPLFKDISASILLRLKKNQSNTISIRTNFDSKLRVEKLSLIQLQNKRGISPKFSNSTHLTINSKTAWPTYPFSNLRKVIYGIHHHIDEKYLSNYLSEFTFKFNRRRIPISAYVGIEYASVKPLWHTNGQLREFLQIDYKTLPRSIKIAS